MDSEAKTTQVVAPAATETETTDVIVTPEVVVVAPVVKYIPISGAKNTTQFTCVKCRQMLFTQTSQVTHAPNAEFHHRFKKETKKGKEDDKQEEEEFDASICMSAFFLPLDFAALFNPKEQADLPPSRRKGGKPLAVNLHDSTVLCTGCGVKVGSSGDNVPCNCGRMVIGASIRVGASKVECMEELTLEELQAKAEEERLADEKEERFLIREGEAREKKEKKDLVNRRIHGKDKASFGDFRGKDAKAQRVKKNKYDPTGGKSKKNNHQLDSDEDGVGAGKQRAAGKKAGGKKNKGGGKNDEFASGSDSEQEPTNAKKKQQARIDEFAGSSSSDSSSSESEQETMAPKKGRNKKR